MAFVCDILSALDYLAPPALAEEWDNVGLLVGDLNAVVDKVGVCLDITDAQIEQAVELGISCIVSHHPVIFKPEEQRFIAPDIAYKLAVAGISAIAAHTNLDCARGGVNDVLAEKIGLINISSVPKGYEDAALPCVLRFGELPEEMSAKGCAGLVKERLCACVRYNDGGRAIKKIALCGGNGGDFTSICARSGFDAYLTGEAKHHDFIAARALGLTLLVAGHYETERPVIVPLALNLQGLLPNVKFIVMEEENPVSSC